MKKIKGTVISDKMQNTVIVAVRYTIRHQKYGKIIKRTTKLPAHNEVEGVGIGDVVALSQTRPYSKTVHFQVVEVVSKRPESRSIESDPKLVDQKEEKTIKAKTKLTRKRAK